MSAWKVYLKKYGGFKLIRQLITKRVFFSSLNQFIVLGRRKKALEILRLSAEYKFINRLKRKNRKLIKQLSESIRNDNYKSSSKKTKIIWICWWQGIENAPELVKKCFNSVCHFYSDWNIQVITSENYSNFVDFPNYIIEKWRAGIISNTHMSDILRLKLLIKYGGLWLDATILATSNEIPKSILESDLFFYQTLKPGANGESVLLSSWLIYAKSNNCILELTLELLYKYWEKANILSDYFLLHYYLTISCEVFSEEYSKIPQFSNEIPHILLLNLFNQFNKYYWKDLKQLSCFHKLSYKLDPNMIAESKGTYYEWIFNNNRMI